MERELVKIVSNNPAHPQGFYIQFKDRMKPGDVEYSDEKPAEIPVTPKNKKKVKR
jgi:hypothetical protein